MKFVSNNAILLNYDLSFDFGKKGGFTIARINYLLKKYQAPYVKGEIHSSKKNLELKRNQRRIEKHILCDELIEEIGIHFSITQKNFIHYLIDYYHADFKNLHAQAKKEAIILVFMLYVKKIDNPKINLNNYSVSKKYGLTDSVFKLVICRMFDIYIKDSPIIFRESTKYDHDILSRNGGKI